MGDLIWGIREGFRFKEMIVNLIFKGFVGISIR